MERSHLNRARERFEEELANKTTHVLHIPDDYEFMQEELMHELRAKLEDWITFPE
jgi:protein-tyrosine phosphatase